MRHSVGSFVISCTIFGKSKNSRDFERICHNGTLIFLKGYDIFFQNHVSFCFYQKIYTNFYFMTNEPPLNVCNACIGHRLDVQFSVLGY